MYTSASNTLVLEFDQAMDQSSLPISDGVQIEFNAAGVNRNGRSPLSWLDGMHLSLSSIITGASVPPDTTRCANTSGLFAADGITQAASWDGFGLTIV